MDTNTPRYRKTSFWQRISLVIFGLFLTLILIETGLRLGGFIILSLQELRNRASLRQKGAYRILCLGESTTQGEWPPFLDEILNQSNLGIKFSVIDKGFIGANTSMILYKLESHLDTYHPDMVITMMGINDWGEHMPYEPVTDSKAINFLKSFRIYKLTQLLWLHIVTRLKELGFHDTASPKLLLREIKLQQAYAEDKDASPSKEPLKSNEAAELKPTDDKAYIELGRSYQDQGKPSEAEASFKRAIELNPKDDEAYIELGKSYRDLGKFSETEASFKKAIETNPRHDGAYGALNVLYIEMGKMELARKYAKEVRDLRLNFYYPITVSNYQKFKAILDKRGITYVCVQYPMRNVEPLKKIFQGNDKGIIFVDNEEIFKDEVAKYGRQNVFIDMFGGEFGHCTKKGNRLLAENIANVILKEVFGK